MLALWTSDLKIGGSTPSPCHLFVSLDKKHYSTLSLSINGYRETWGKPCDGLAFHPGGVAILSVASCYRDWDKLRPRGPPWLVCDFNLP